MAFFLFPKSLCDDFERIIANFLWQRGKGRGVIHWCEWKVVCNSKANEGLGFRNFGLFNTLLLAKQGWRLLQNLQSLLARILKAKNFPNSTFLD